MHYFRQGRNPQSQAAFSLFKTQFLRQKFRAPWPFLQTETDLIQFASFGQ